MLQLAGTGMLLGFNLKIKPEKDKPCAGLI
jgi:hypothetical protein